MKNVVYGTVLALSAVGCSKKQAPPPTVIDGEKVPEWMINPHLGCAAGVYQTRGNVSMAVDMAQIRATANLGRQLQVYVNQLVQQYIEEGEQNEDIYTEDLARNISEVSTKVSMSGAIPKKMAVHGKNYYSLVCMEPEIFISAFDQMDQLDEKVRKGLRKRAEKAFQALED